MGDVALALECRVAVNDNHEAGRASVRFFVALQRLQKTSRIGTRENMEGAIPDTKFLLAPLCSLCASASLRQNGSLRIIGVQFHRARLAAQRIDLDAHRARRSGKPRLGGLEQTVGAGGQAHALPQAKCSHRHMQQPGSSMGMAKGVAQGREIVG